MVGKLQREVAWCWTKTLNFTGGLLRHCDVIINYVINVNDVIIRIGRIKGKMVLLKSTCIRSVAWVNLKGGWVIPINESYWMSHIGWVIVNESKMKILLFNFRKERSSLPLRPAFCWRRWRSATDHRNCFHITSKGTQPLFHCILNNNVIIMLCSINT